MYEKYLLARNDFQNVSTNGQITGFQIKIRIPYYRGVYLSQIEDVKLKVDEEEFLADVMTFTVPIHGPNVPDSPTKTYTAEQLAMASSERWYFGDPMLLTIRKPGGLKQGVHEVSLAIAARNSYRPRNDPEGLFVFPAPPGQPAMNGPGAHGYLATQKMCLVI